MIPCRRFVALLLSACLLAEYIPTPVSAAPALRVSGRFQEEALSGAVDWALQPFQASALWVRRVVAHGRRQQDEAAPPLREFRLRWILHPFNYLEAHHNLDADGRVNPQAVRDRAIAIFGFMQGSGLLAMTLAAAATAFVMGRPEILSMSVSGLLAYSAAYLAGHAVSLRVFKDHPATLPASPRPRPPLKIDVRFSWVFYAALKEMTPDQRETFMASLYGWLNAAQQMPLGRRLDLGKPLMKGLKEYDVHEQKHETLERLVFRASIREDTILLAVRIMNKYAGSFNERVEEALGSGVVGADPAADRDALRDLRDWLLAVPSKPQLTPEAFEQARTALSTHFFYPLMRTVRLNDILRELAYLRGPEIHGVSSNFEQSGQINRAVHQIQDVLDECNGDLVEAAYRWVGGRGREMTENRALEVLSQWQAGRKRLLDLIHVLLMPGRDVSTDEWHDIASVYDTLAGRRLQEDIRTEVETWAQRQLPTEAGLETIWSAYGELGAASGFKSDAVEAGIQTRITALDNAVQKGDLHDRRKELAQLRRGLAAHAARLGLGELQEDAEVTDFEGAVEIRRRLDAEDEQFEAHRHVLILRAIGLDEPDLRVRAERYNTRAEAQDVEALLKKAATATESVKKRSDALQRWSLSQADSQHAIAARRPVSEEVTPGLMEAIRRAPKDRPATIVGSVGMTAYIKILRSAGFKRVVAVDSVAPARGREEWARRDSRQAEDPVEIIQEDLSFVDPTLPVAIANLAAEIRKDHSSEAARKNAAARGLATLLKNYEPLRSKRIIPEAGADIVLGSRLGPALFKDAVRCAVELFFARELGLTVDPESLVDSSFFIGTPGFAQLQTAFDALSDKTEKSQLDLIRRTVGGRGVAALLVPAASRFPRLRVLVFRLLERLRRVVRHFAELSKPEITRYAGFRQIQKNFGSALWGGRRTLVECFTLSVIPEERRSPGAKSLFTRAITAMPRLEVMVYCSILLIGSFIWWWQFKPNLSNSKSGGSFWQFRLPQQPSRPAPEIKPELPTPPAKTHSKQTWHFEPGDKDSAELLVNELARLYFELRAHPEHPLSRWISPDVLEKELHELWLSNAAKANGRLSEMVIIYEPLPLNKRKNDDRYFISRRMMKINLGFEVPIVQAAQEMEKRPAGTLTPADQVLVKELHALAVAPFVEQLITYRETVRNPRPYIDYEIRLLGAAAVSRSQVLNPILSAMIDTPVMVRAVENSKAGKLALKQYLEASGLTPKVLRSLQDLPQFQKFPDNSGLWDDLIELAELKSDPDELQLYSLEHLLAPLPEYDPSDGLAILKTIAKADPLTAVAVRYWQVKVGLNAAVFDMGRFYPMEIARPFILKELNNPLLLYHAPLRSPPAPKKGAFLFREEAPTPVSPHVLSAS